MYACFRIAFKNKRIEQNCKTSVIFLLKTFSLTLRRRSRLIDISNREVYNIWQSVNTAIKEFCDTPICKQCATSYKALVSYS